MVIIWLLYPPAVAQAVPVPEEVPIEPPPVLTVQEKILQTFPDAPIMVHVAEAEAPDGKGGINCAQKNPGSSATGCFQILKGTFADPYYGCTGDVRNEDDNIACARKIYDKSGTRPWNESKGTWGRYVRPASS